MTQELTMDKRNHSVIVTISVLLMLLSPLVVYAGIGQTAGELNFGQLQRGAQKTLSFGVINTDPTPMPVAAVVEGELSKIALIEPKHTIIPVGESVTFSLTVYMPKNAKVGTAYPGAVVVKTDYESPGGGGVGANLLLAVRKDGTAIAAKEITPAQFPFVLVVVVAVIAIVALLAVRSTVLRKRDE